MNSKIIFCVLLAISAIGVLKAAPADDWVDLDEAAQDEQDDEIVSQDEIEAALDESVMMDEGDVQEDLKVTLKGRRSELISVLRVVRNMGPQYTACLKAQREPLRKIRSDTKALLKKCRTEHTDRATCEKAALAASAEPLGKVLFDLAQCIKDTTVRSSGVTRSWLSRVRKGLGKVINVGRRVCGSGYVNCAAIGKKVLTMVG